MDAWNDWYHVTCNTYGTWLPGDPRGWRERGHRKHCEGDYRNPPPKGSGDKLHQRSKALLTQPPVRLNATQREAAGHALVEMLTDLGKEALALSLDAVHFHVLARFPHKQVRPPVGRAKKHAWHTLHHQGLSEKLWQRESNVTPITGRQHQVNVFDYIVRHREKGAWVWTFRDGLDWLNQQDE